MKYHTDNFLIATIQVQIATRMPCSAPNPRTRPRFCCSHPSRATALPAPNDDKDTPAPCFAQSRQRESPVPLKRP